MPTLITTLDGCDIVVETTPVPGLQLTSADGVVGRAEDAFTQALDTIKRVSTKLGNLVREAHADGPEVFEVAFGIKISATGDIWVAKASGEAQLTAKLTWRRS